MAHVVNDDAIVRLIKELVTTPSPSGNTDEVIGLVEDHLKKMNVKTERSHKGGLLATIEGADNTKHRFLTA
ncbi:MAG TPA: peptidase M42, partial [Bacillales bacterium]